MDRSLSRYRGVRTAVLGASGFIGRWTARALCAQGARVHLVVRSRPSAREVFARFGISGEIHQVDVRERQTVEALLRSLQPTITFNLAGYGIDRSERDERMAYEINGRLVGWICEATREARDPNWPGQQLVHVGSAMEYGDIRGDLSEDSVPNPTTLYGNSKLVGTRLLAQGCRSLGIRGVTARLFTVYGPGEHEGRLLPSLLDAAGKDGPIGLTAGLQKRDFTYVEDVAEGLLRLGLAAASPGIAVNLATGRLTAVRDFVITAASMLQIAGSRLDFGAIPVREEEMEHGPVTLSTLVDLIEWTPPTAIEDGLRQTIALASVAQIPLHQGVSCGAHP